MSGVERGNHAQPHAKQITHAPEPPMLCPDEEQDAVPIAGNAERQMPHAWRQFSRRADRRQERALPTWPIYRPDAISHGRCPSASFRSSRAV
jgi:hypothetical protein